MRKGFTILELMVACALMALLVTILTAIFSASSAAWSTGTAGVINLGKSRQQIAKFNLVADNLLDNQGHVVRSIWKIDGDGGFADRAVGKAIAGVDTVFDPAQPNGWKDKSISSGQARGGEDFVVGVASDGPDRQPNTWDDITTWPVDQ